MVVVPSHMVFSTPEFEFTEFPGPKVHHAALHLQDTAHEQEWLAGDEIGVGGGAIWCDDDVEHARLILEGEKQEPLGGRRALAADDETGYRGDLAIAALGQQIFDGAHAVGSERRTGVLQGMPEQ